MGEHPSSREGQHWRKILTLAPTRVPARSRLTSRSAGPLVPCSFVHYWPKLLPLALQSLRRTLLDLDARANLD